MNELMLTSWGALVSQAVIDGTIQTVLGFIIMVFTTVIVYASVVIKKEPRTKGDQYAVFVCVVIGLGAAVFDAMGLGLVIMGIKHLINPEFYAIQYLVDGIKQF